MTHKSYRQESRKDWGTSQEFNLKAQQIQLGALLRIADATEKMCRDRENLENSYKYMHQSRDRFHDDLKREKHSNASLRGHLKRIKNERDELSTMVKVFRACIKTGFFPARGSQCEKKVIELVGDYPNEHS